MAYCKHCGAYIPDGLSACLACGYDEAAETSNTASEREENEDFRRKYEEERRLRQEENRRWAEQEKLRREEQFRRQEEYRRQAEEEKARREAEEARRREAEQQARAYSTVYRAASAGGQKHRVLAALSYLGPLFILPRFFCEDDRFARYHARQGMTLFVFSLLCDALSAVFPAGWILSLLRIYLIYKGMMNALNERIEPLPWIGKYGEKQ